MTALIHIVMNWLPQNLADVTTAVLISCAKHNDVMTWTSFSHCFWWLVDYPHKWLVLQDFDMFLVVAWRNGWTNSQIAGDLRCHGTPVPSDAIWRYWSGSTLAQIMACCLTAPSHYLNQCWLLISEVPWHLPDNNFTVSAQSTILYNEFENLTFIITSTAKSPKGQWVHESVATWGQGIG